MRLPHPILRATVDLASVILRSWRGGHCAESTPVAQWKIFASSTSVGHVLIDHFFWRPRISPLPAERMLNRMLSCSMLVAVSAGFLSPLPAQTRQSGSAARSAVKMLPPAPPTPEEKARKSFVQYEMRSESSRTDACTLARHRPAKPARAATRPALPPACRPPSPPPHAPLPHSPPASPPPERSTLSARACAQALR